MKQCIIVLGMHRSGTSATTGILSFFDAFLGEELIEPNEENPKGFFENRKILNLNKAILEHQGSGWDDYHFDYDKIQTNDFNSWVDQAKEILIEEFKYVNVFIIKDPRLCLLFPVWETALETLNVDIKVIVPHRSPLEVAHSLKYRNKFSIEKGLLLWASYTFSLEKYSRQQARLQLIFPDDFITSEKLINIIKNFTQLSINKRRLNDAQSFFEKKLNHQYFPFDLISEKIPSYISGIIQAISQRDFNDKNLFDRLYSDYKKTLSITRTQEVIGFIEAKPVLKETIKNLEGNIKSLENNIEEYKNNIGLLQDKIENIKIEHKKDQDLIHNESYNFQTIISLLKKYIDKIECSASNKNNFKNKLKNTYFLGKNRQEVEQMILLKNKIEEISLNNICHFSEMAYLDINKDIKQAIEQGNFGSALEHYINYGYEEVQQGKRKASFNAIGYQELYLKIELSAHRAAQKNKPLCQKFYCEISEKSDTILPLLEKSRLENTVLVSIVILNRNGQCYLEKLFAAISNNTPNILFEIIVVDNASSDNSLQYLQKNEFKLPVQIIKNKSNESFSVANNKAVAQANGEYILLANNDIEPLKNWLVELLKTATEENNVGSVGARLIYPYREDFANSCQIQHAGIGFINEGDFLRPYNMGNGCQYNDQHYSLINKRVAVTAACLLIKKEIYLEVGGLDESYNYGYEDVDFGLKLLKHGYSNYYTPNAVAFHYEFGTQETDENKTIIQRRQNNINIFRHKWFSFLKQSYWEEKLSTKASAPLIFTEAPMTVAIAVTDSGDDVSAGDYFTAQELASALEIFGWRVIYLSKFKEEWYHIPMEVDLLITLLDAYDVQQLPKRKKELISIAWARNWFDKWCNNPSFNHYDMVFASSITACNYIKDHSKQEACLLPIASNPERFLAKDQYLNNKKYQCDICFTGSYWNNDRDIMSYLNRSILSQYKVHIYGANWDKFEKFKAHYKGFVNYEEMPFIYHNAKIAIDDANHVTKPYGSVNSRVFDALISGTLVITNGVLGSKELFDGELPYYETEQQLTELLQFYLNNEEARKEKVAKLRDFVLKHHTYQYRANEIQRLLQKKLTQVSISLKIPAPNWEVSHQWGDYHLGVLLKEQLEKLNYTVTLHMLNQWDSKEASACDVSILFRGLSRHKLQAQQLNIMWNISHPDKVALEEYEEYDLVFIASEYWANEIKQQVSTPVSCLLQCTDSKRFKAVRTEDQSIQHQLLFVGNSRKVFRKIIKDVLPSEYELSVYGNNWDGLIANSYIKGEYIDNKELYRYYAGANVLLNDHWDDMKEKGFISNRLYDALACGAFIVSDEVKGMEDISQYIKIYHNKEELARIIQDRMENPKDYKEMINEGMKYVRKYHTFELRAKVFSTFIEKYYASI